MYFQKKAQNVDAKLGKEEKEDILMSKYKYSIAFQKETIKLGYFADYVAKRNELFLKQASEKRESTYLNEATGEIVQMVFYPNYISEWERAVSKNPYMDCARTMYNAKARKISRLRKHFSSLIFDSKCYLVTLTFTDKALATTTEKYRRNLVSRYLSNQCNKYAANIDFGGVNESLEDKKSKTNREHYHAITDHAIKPTEWEYGHAHCVRIFNTKLDVIRVTKYITKISLDLIENDKGVRRLIYPKKK